MIIPKANKLDDEQLKKIEAVVAEFDCEIQVIKGANRSIYAIVGDERHEVMINRLVGLDYIDRVDTIESPYKLMDRRSELADGKLCIAGVTVGEEPLFIAGLCTVDPKNPQYCYDTADALKDAGVHVLRGGVWKPRTMPYTYQGDVQALDILVEARNRTGLPINTEVMNVEQLKMVMDAEVDMIQIGARNALNYSLLKEIGDATANSDVVVLLKRGRSMSSVNEFIAAAEYIAAAGNPNILLCPRGSLPSMDGYRNHPDESITALIKDKTWAAVVVDPSHSVGRSEYVPLCALAGMAYGADGLCIESHIDPTCGIGDDPLQAITPDVFKQLIVDARAIWEISRRQKAINNREL